MPVAKEYPQADYIERSYLIPSLNKSGSLRGFQPKSASPIVISLLVIT